MTIVSNLETGEPVWIAPGRGQETLAGWFTTLSPEEKAGIELFAMDMHAPFAAAVRIRPLPRLHSGSRTAPYLRRPARAGA